MRRSAVLGAGEGLVWAGAQAAYLSTESEDKQGAYKL